MRAFLQTTVGVAALLASPAIADPSITVSPPLGHPQIVTHVSGSGFMPGEKVDLFFDTTDVRHARADDQGNFVLTKLRVPADALPGAHTVSGVGRKAGDSAQSAFNVTTKWHEFGFDAQGARSNPYENVINTSNVNTLSQVWSVGGGFSSSPAYSNGTTFIGFDDGTLRAYDNTGALLWKANTGGPIEASPAVVNGIVYIGSDSNDKIYAFNAASGAKVWDKSLASAMNDGPAVADGVVFATSGDGSVYAFNALTGDHVWTTGLPPNPTPPAVAAGVIYVGSQIGLNAFNASTGAPLWQADAGDNIDSPAAIANGVVYVEAEDNNLKAFDAVSGDQLWKAAIGGGGTVHDASPAVANGTVYASSPNGTVYAFDTTTGAPLWSTDVGGRLTSPAVADGVVYVGSDNNNIFALDAATGAQLWTVAADNSVYSSPAVADGMVFDASDGTLYAFALNGGNNAVYKHKARPSFSKLLPALHKKHAG